MKRGVSRYIWQARDWPTWRWDLHALAGALADVHRAQGHLAGRLADVGLGPRKQASLAALTDDVVKTSEIEGEALNAASVRSSIARRLGVDIGALAPADRQVDGVVEMVLDATTRCHAPLSARRLFGWHAALFPTGRGGLGRIRVGAWRNDAGGPMQVVSGPVHRPNVHFEAPPATRIKDEAAAFFAWANADTGEPALIKAGLAHLWFVTLHPLDDGNGRIARAVGDLFLARADAMPQRFYSLSAQIQLVRREYYDVLERTQQGTLDVTEWMTWLLAQLRKAVETANTSLDGVLFKARFWQRWAQTPMNERQVTMLNRLLDGFEGKLTSSKWASIARCSPDTALRDINDLVERGVVQRTAGGGRSTGYEIVPVRGAGAMT